jgi:hypothetical protein
MTDAEEIQYNNDCLVISIDIVDCPMAEIPLTEVFDVPTKSLVDNYHDVIRNSVQQQLEHTTWLSANLLPTLTDPGFGMYHARDRNSVIMLQKPALQRLINQRLKDRSRPSDIVHVPVLICFLIPDSDIPKPPSSSAASSSVRESRSKSSRRGPPSVIDTSEQVDTPSVAEDAPVVDAPFLPDTNAAAPTFRGYPVDMRPPDGYGPPTAAGRFRSPTDPVLPRPLFDSATTGRTGGALTRTPTRMHPFSAEVTFGAESFEDYMCQFMCGDVKFKDFRKASIPKFDSSKNDSFVHWYKLFCSTCLQWGVWCPPYESAQEDSLHGKWWTLLPASVREKDAFMSGLIYTALNQESTFPNGSREQGAVEGCPPQAGYHAVYSLFRLHHPLLHSVFSTASEIPRQRRTEPFSLYIRRLQDFMVRERQSTRTYTESEALDLSVRNLTSEWRSEIRRLVERDKRTGHDGAHPFKLSLAQLATTFVEYANEIGRDPPSSQMSSSNRASTSIIRRIETASPDFSSDTNLNLDEEEIDLMVRAISQNQDASSVCLGCHRPGHKLEDCNRFVDYIVAESLAQRNPQLKIQIANSHKQFRSRLNSAGARDRPPQTGVSKPRTMRRIMEENETNSDALATPSGDDAEDDSSTGYQQNSIRASALDESDFEDCFEHPIINSVTITVAEEDPALPSSERVHLDATSDPILLRRLAETYDQPRHLSFAHADNGSMACTANDRHLLFAYRPLTRTNVRLFDAGHHAHHPVGVGFLCVPVDNRGSPGGPLSVFIQTYYTPTIPGIIISHAAISKQLGTDGYHMSSFADGAGHILFPHCLRRAQDIYIILQPMARRGGLTFTEALITPTPEAHTAPLPSDHFVRRLCTDHAQIAASTILDPINGMTCGACHSPPSPDFR